MKYCFILEDDTYYICEADNPKFAIIYYLKEYIEKIDEKMALAFSQCEEYTVKDLMNYIDRYCDRYERITNLYLISEEINLDKLD